MKCKKCSSTSLVPVLCGSPDHYAWQAMLSGKVQLGGSFSSEEARWYCLNCSCDQAGGTKLDHDLAIENAMSSLPSQKLDVVYDPMELMMGRRALSKTVYSFAKLGYTSVKLDPRCDDSISAFANDHWEDFEWPLARYQPQIRTALAANALRDFVEVDGIKSQLVFHESKDALVIDFLAAMNVRR